jgi:DNA repair protein RadC
MRSASRLRDLPEEERPRERLVRLGAAALSDRELLAILLRVGKRRESALTLAQSILEEAGGVVPLSLLSVPQLVKKHRLGPVQAITVAAALEFSRRASASAPRRTKFASPQEVTHYLRVKHAHRTQETTGALYLDAKNRLLKDSELYRGTLDRALVAPREILKEAILEDAAAVIVYHNHPSGDPEPSAEDLRFTELLRRAAMDVGVNLVDHIIVGREGCVSFRERGLF